MKNKIISSFEEAVKDIQDGATIMVFAWAGTACPQNLVRAICRKGVKDLTVISHNFSFPRLGNYFFGMDEIYTPLHLADQVKKVITAFPGQSYFGRVSPLEKRVAAGEVELEVMSHGTLAERIRAGASGIGGFYTRVGVGTVVAKGKEKKIIDGKEYILEKPLRADFGLVRAHKADKRGNLVYRGSVRGCNPVIAMAADVTIAEVDEIVEPGELSPEIIITPEVFVHRIVKIPEGSPGSRAYMESMFHKGLDVLKERGEWK